jgi:hypothetical protein
MFTLITTLVIGNFNNGVVIRPNYRLDYVWYFLGGKLQIFYYTERLPQVKDLGQFKQKTTSLVIA